MFLFFLPEYRLKVMISLLHIHWYCSRVDRSTLSVMGQSLSAYKLYTKHLYKVTAGLKWLRPLIGKQWRLYLHWELNLWIHNYLKRIWIGKMISYYLYLLYTGYTYKCLSIASVDYIGKISCGIPEKSVPELEVLHY